MSLIGKSAPQWSAAAYVNGEQQTIGNDDYDAKWYVLYFYPLDFTFI